MTNSTMRNLGSASLDMAYVGSGRFDGFFQNNISLWDIAAGIVIVKEAGGKINDLNPTSLEELSIFAGSNSIYEKMLNTSKTRFRQNQIESLSWMCNCK